VLYIIVPALEKCISRQDAVAAVAAVVVAVAAFVAAVVVV
jgi:hypothetical protein